MKIFNGITFYQYPYIDEIMVSKCGQVYSKERVVNSGSGTRVMQEMVKAQSNDKDGYKLTKISINGQSNTMKVHRLVCETFLEGIDGKDEVNHINGIKSDNRIENLEWNNRLDNIQHAIDMGLIKIKKHPKIKCPSCKRIFQSKKDKKIYCSVNCVNISKNRTLPICKEGLYLLLSNNTFTYVGNKFSVSCTTIRKWCVKLGIPSKASYYKNKK